MAIYFPIKYCVECGFPVTLAAIPLANLNELGIMSDVIMAFE
jgi:hypothetical protein